LDRVWSALDVPFDERRAGWDLLFLQGIVIGVHGPSLIVAVEADGRWPPIALRCLAPNDNPALRYRENLRQLSRCPGLPIQFIARVRLEEPRTVHLLAVGPWERSENPDEPSAPPFLKIPGDSRARVNLGLDRMRGSWLVGAGDAGTVAALTPRDEESSLPDPLAPLRRRIHRVALGGRGTLPPEAGDAVCAEIASFERRMLPNAAEVLRELVESAASMERTLSGQRKAASADILARAWIRAAAYEGAATRALHRAAWD